MLLRWQFWLPGLGLSAVLAVGTYAFILFTGEMGYALFVAVPFSVGALLGYVTRVAVWLTLLLTLALIGGVVFGLVSLNLSGFFCGAVLAGIFLVPALGGAVLGFSLRAVFYRASWDHRRYYFAALLAGLPLGVEGVENLLPHERVIAEVRTGLTFQASPREAWNSILFYEQVEHEPPWLLTLALPRPVQAEGSKAAVGDMQRCIYQKGHLVKQITQREDQQLLAFRVTEQHLHFERDVTLVDGSFTLEPSSGEQTRVVLTTRYLRHLRPAWLWEPIERKVIHTLHGHVLEGMRRKLHKDGDGYEVPGTNAQPVEIAAGGN
jgi:hypothetical protein